MNRSINPPKTTDTNRPTQRNRRLVLTAALVVIVLVAGGAATTVASADSPVVDVENGTVAPGETVSVNVTLSDAPDGVAGYEIVVSVENQTTAEINESTIPDTFGLTDKNSSDGQVTLVASDTGDEVQSGASDVRLGTLTLSGVATGETLLSVQVNKFDADGGTSINATTQAGTLIVESNSTAPDDGTPDDGTSDDGTADNGPSDDGSSNNTTETGGGVGITQMGIVALAVLGVLVGYVASRASSDDDEDDLTPPPP